MEKINYTTVNSTQELEQIIQLQLCNLPISISKLEKEKEGFVTVQHDLSILRKMNDIQPHIIAKDKDKVVGYALCMSSKFKDEIEVLQPMFMKIEDHLDTQTSYITMGQICIDKDYRRQGIFRGLYQSMKYHLKDKYDLLITEIDTNNLRSLQAHYAVGFKTMITYEASGVEWQIVYWNWT